MTVVLGLLAFVSLLAGAALTGALALTLGRLGEGTVGLAVAGVAALFVNVLLPAVIAAPLSKKRKRPSLAWSSTFLVWNLALGGALFGFARPLGQQAITEHGRWFLPAAARVEQPVEQRVEPPVQKTSMNARELFTARADSVVLIRTQEKKSIDEVLETLLGEKKKQGQPTRDIWINALGSGFFVSKDGVFVTNHHVLGDAGRAAVFTRDGRRFDAVDILVSDPANDLVLAQIRGEFSPAPVVTSTAVIGEVVFAIGSPLGLEFTLTQGIISAKREVQNTRFVQTQTDIASGSSGGPLFNDRGEVVGVNTAAAGAAGLNLAVDASHVRALLAAAREPKRLADYVRNAEVTSLELEDGKLTPVDRMNLISVLGMVAVHADECIEELPENAFIELNFSKDGGIKSNLDPGAEKCFVAGNMERVLKTIVHVGLGRKDAAGQPIRARAKIEGLSLAGARGRPRGEGTLELRMIAGETAR